jgi:hypothetical protein
MHSRYDDRLSAVTGLGRLLPCSAERERTDAYGSNARADAEAEGTTVPAEAGAERRITTSLAIVDDEPCPEPESGLVCPICLCLFSNPHSLRGCGHEFCLRCIHRVCEVSTSCPVVRPRLPIVALRIACARCDKELMERWMGYIITQCRNSHATEDGRLPALADLVTPNRCVCSGSLGSRD